MYRIRLMIHNDHNNMTAYVKNISGDGPFPEIHAMQKFLRLRKVIFYVIDAARCNQHVGFSIEKVE